jgi:hypothetical protein
MQESYKVQGSEGMRRSDKGGEGKSKIEKNKSSEYVCKYRSTSIYNDTHTTR